MSELLGQVAIVTGGASGIGAASADLPRHAGATVIVADIELPKEGAGRIVASEAVSFRRPRPSDIRVNDEFVAARRRLWMLVKSEDPSHSQHKGSDYSGDKAIPSANQYGRGSR